MFSIQHSTELDSQKAALQLSKNALAKLEGAPTWAIAYCAGKHNETQFFETLKAELGGIPIVGGAAVGVITNDFYGYNGFESNLIVFNKQFEMKAIETSDLALGQQEAGQDLGRKLKDKMDKEDTLMLFFDTLISSPPPQIYSGSEIIKGFNNGIGADDFKIVGSGLVADLGLMKSFVFTGDTVKQHVVTGIVIPSKYKLDYRIFHGCEPISSYMEITKIEGNLVFEIDHRPALDVVLETLQLEKTEEVLSNLATIVTLGENRGEKFGDFDDSKYVNRMIVAGLPELGALVLFEADFEVGTQIQIMSRSNDLMIESAENQAQSIVDALDKDKTIFAFYIDCAGRTAAFNGSEEEETEIIQNALKDVPLFGFYSGVEIAPLMGKSRPLDWTGVLVAFSEK
jgi:hypothetical protein